MLSHQLTGFISLHYHFLTLVSFATAQNMSMLQLFQNLIGDNPTVLLLEDSDSELEVEMRDILELTDNAGQIVFTFNPWWLYSKHRLKPKIGALKTTPFRWTFICFIEAKRTKAKADKYLQELLSVSHGRLDRIILIGLDRHISIFFKTLRAQKFLNIIGIVTDASGVYMRQHHWGKLRFSFVTDLARVQWITSSTEGLYGQHFRISGTKFPPFLDWVYKDGKQKLMGQNYRIFHEGSLYHNYTYEFNPINKWKLTGQKLPNNTWDGVFGDLIYGKADIASVSTETVLRRPLADFVGPFGRSHLVFVSAPPEKQLGKYPIFLAFTPFVWSLILATFIVFVGLIYIALKMAVKRGTINNCRTKGKIFSRALMTVWMLSFEQTEEKRPKGVRMLMIMWVAFMVVILTGYRSNLAASMSIRHPEEKPKTFRQLSEQSNYNINFDLSGISAWNHFEESSNLMIKKLRDRSNKMENTTECILSSFMAQDTICIGWDFTLNFASAKNMTIPQLLNPLMISTDSVWAAWYTFALPKHSAFTDAFQTIGQTFFEAGMTAYWRARLLNEYRTISLKWRANQQSKMYDKLEKVRRSTKLETQPLKLENFMVVFILLGLGLTVSVLRFCYEIWSLQMRGASGWINERTIGNIHSGGYSRRGRGYKKHSRIATIGFVP